LHGRLHGHEHGQGRALRWLGRRLAGRVGHPALDLLRGLDARVQVRAADEHAAERINLVERLTRWRALRDELVVRLIRGVGRAERRERPALHDFVLRELLTAERRAET